MDKGPAEAALATAKEKFSKGDYANSGVT